MPYKLPIICLIGFIFCSLSVSAKDDPVNLVKKGNISFNAKDYTQAIEFYRNAESELPESPELNYNIAGALHNSGKYEEAIELYNKALNSTEPDIQTATHYNLGNTYFRMEDYQNAIKSYEKSLELNPDDMNAKYNLELSRKRLKEQIKPEQQNQDDQQQQDQQKQQDEQDKENKDQQQDQKEEDQQGQQEQDQQEKQEEQGDQKKEKQQPKEIKKEMTKEDAERILNALKDEQDIQKKIKRDIRGGNYSGKDW